MSPLSKQTLASAESIQITMRCSLLNNRSWWVNTLLRSIVRSCRKRQIVMDDKVGMYSLISIFELDLVN